MKPLTFKVWVDPKGKYYRRKRYYQVYLFRDQGAMYAFADEVRQTLGMGRLAHTYGGLTMGFVHDSARRRGLAGMVLLGGRHCHMAGVVSHEMAHAAHYIAIPLMSSTRKGVATFPDEKLAWLQGEFVRQFWTAWWRLRKCGKIKEVRGVA